MVANIPAPLPSPLLETMLHLAPLDVLLFDTDLVCRYAALAGDTLFGHSAAELKGRHAEEIVPPGQGDLRTALNLAARTAATYQYPSYRYTYRDTEGATDMLFCWSVRVEPITLRDYRGQEEFRGVLVTFADVQDLADENERLRRDNTALEQENARLQRELAQARRREVRPSVVRNLLTVVMGYLQLIARRPATLGGRPAAEVIEAIVLPSLRDVLEAVDAVEAPEPADDGDRDAR